MQYYVCVHSFFAVYFSCSDVQHWPVERVKHHRHNRWRQHRKVSKWKKISWKSIWTNVKWFYLAVENGLVALDSLALVASPVQTYNIINFIGTISLSWPPFASVSFFLYLPLSLHHPPSISPVPGQARWKKNRKIKEWENEGERGRSDFHSTLDHWSGV